LYNNEDQELSTDSDEGKEVYSWCDLKGCACTGINDKYWTASAAYDNAKAEKVNLSSEIVDRSTLTDDVNTKITVSRTTTTTKSFTHTAGASVTVGTSFTVQTPKVSTTASLEMTASYEFSYGSESSETVTISKTYECPGEAGKKTECLAMVFREKVTIPYTITWTFKNDATCKCEDKGTYTQIASRSDLKKDTYDL